MSAQLMSSDEYLTKYYACKQQLQLPLKINLYFTFLQATLKDDVSHKNATNFQGFSPLLFGVFCQLSLQQKAYYLYSNISSIKNQYEKFQTSSDNKINKNEQGNSITSTGQFCQSIMGMAYWSKVQLIFNYETKQIKLETKNRNFTIDLRLYLIRKSKKYKSTFVLQAISDIVPAADRKISLFFKSVIFDKIYNEILKCIISYRNQQLYRIALQQIPTSMNSSMAEVSYIGMRSKALTFLDSKNVNQFLNYKDQILKQFLKGPYHFQNVYADHNCKIGVQRSNHKQPIYKLESNFNCSAQILKKTFLQKYKLQSFKYMIQSQELQKFSNKYSSVYQKMIFQHTHLSFNTVQQIIIEQINDKETTYENQQLIFQKGIKGIKLPSMVQFLMVKVKSLGTKNKSKLVVVGSFNSFRSQGNKKHVNEHNTIEVEQDQQIIIMFLLELSEMIFRKQIQPESVLKMLQQLRSDSDAKQSIMNQFITVQGNFANDKHNELVLDVDDIEESTDNQLQIDPIKDTKLKRATHSLAVNLDVFNNQINFLSKTSNINEVESVIDPVQKTYLNHIFSLLPSPASGKQKQEEKKHFIYEQWIRKPKGGLICKDNAIINEQKKVANYIISTLGKRILQQKGLLNLSLPVTIFKAESHLHSVARNLSFAPLILEKATQMNTIQRLKMSVLFAISVTISSISVSKPFNPILGQTLQVWIDGCPAYFEQISHHPPIVAYYMIGRGYKIHGCIGPKTTFGFNSIIGYSEQPSFIEFDDGTVIEINFGKMTISGILLGQRTFSFTDKMYAIDSKNKLFCDINLGSNKFSFFTKSNSAQDMVNGKILSVTDKFIQQFYKTSKTLYPNKQHIKQEISNLDGIWSGRVQFDNKKYIDFSQTNGCVVAMEQYPLPSDSRYRRDIQCLKQGCINSSQSEKQKLQKIQRRDEKLRKQMNIQNNDE